MLRGLRHGLAYDSDISPRFHKRNTRSSELYLPSALSFAGKRYCSTRETCHQ